MMAAVCLQTVAQDEFLTSVAPGNKYALISCSNNIPGYVMYADGEGAIRVGNPDQYSITDPYCQFEFESTDEDGWLYLKNVATGEYFQKMPTQSGVNLPLADFTEKADTTWHEGDQAVLGDPVTDITLGQWFVLKGAGSYPYYVYADEDVVLGCYTSLPELLPANAAFRFVQEGEKVVLQTYGGQYVGRSEADTDDETALIPVGDLEDAATWTYEMLDATKGQVRLASDNHEAVHFLHLQNDHVCYWDGDGAQSQFIMYSCTTEPMPEFTVAWTYAERFQVVIANGDQVWLKTPTGQHVNMYFGNPQNGGVTYWTGSGDASRWHIVLVEEGGDPHEQLKVLMDAAQNYMNLKEHAGEVGYYSEEAYQVLADIFETLAMEYDPEICTDDDARYYIAQLDEAMKEFLGSGVVFPENDKYYRLRNTVTGEYAAMTDASGYTTDVDGETVVCGCGIMLPFNEADPRQVWHLVYNDEGYVELYSAYSGLCADNTDPLTGFTTEPTSNWELFNNTGEGHFQIHIKTSYYGNFSLREYFAAGEPDAEADRATQAIKLYTYSSWSTTYWVFEECEAPAFDTDEWSYSNVGYYADRQSYLEAHTRYPEFGETDCSAEPETAFSDYYSLSQGGFVTFKFYNYTDQADALNNWTLVAANAQRDSGDFLEYFELHNNATGCTPAASDSIPDYFATGTIASDFDMATFTSDMNGAYVEMTVTYATDGTLDMVSTVTTAAGKTYTYTYKGVSGIEGSVILYLTTQKGYISQTAPDTSVRTALADDPDAPVYDLFGRRADVLQPATIYIQNGKKFMVK